MKTVAIIGGGLAGTACAYVLKAYGAEPVIYESGPALAGLASGNPIGLYNPRIMAERTPESDYFTSAFALALRTFLALDNIGWMQCGSLHLMTDETRRKRFLKAKDNWGWPEDHLRLVGVAEASEIAGVSLNHEALYMPQAGCVSPAKLCAAYARDVPVYLNRKIGSLADIEADAVILACGTGIKDFTPARHLPLRPVRGQITVVRASASSKALCCNLCYGGYFSPAFDGAYTLGATFQHWLDHAQVLEEDDTANITGLREVAPALAVDLQILDSRAGVRVAAPDHMPVVGRLAGHDSLYVSGAHGSHGILSSLLAAHVLAAQIMQASLTVSRDTAEKISPARFPAIQGS